MAFSASESVQTSELAANSELPVWLWPLLLFAGSFFLGIVAVLAGVGGGVLFVPFIGSVAPFNIDFIRCAGLIVALAGSISAAPSLLRKGLVSLRLAMPMALFASTSSILGAMIGLALPSHIVQLLMGITILAIALIMLFAQKSDYPEILQSDWLAEKLKIRGCYKDEFTGHEVPWTIHRTPLGFILFSFIGFMAGMFGLGAGWANVPTLNLVLGAPLRLSVATSNFMVGITDTTAAWVYIHNGALLPVVVVPSVLGMMLGAKTGVRILRKINTKGIRISVIVLLFFAGIRTLLKGLGVWK